MANSEASNSDKKVLDLLTKIVNASNISGVDISLSLGTPVICVPAASLVPLASALKSNREVPFEMLMDITAVDHLDAKEDRYEVVYHLVSISQSIRIRLKVPVAESKAEVPSLVALWPGANFMERETWDMYGIVFSGHPELKRLLMYDEFVGHPLRKDYPVQKKQPRVNLRSPEVKNTALNLVRPELVQIGSRGVGSQDRRPGTQTMVTRGS